jgi:hypothetical protein
MFESASRKLHLRSAAMISLLESRLDRIMQVWLLIAGLASAARIATSPSHGLMGVSGLLPYLLLIIAPFASMVLALRWFADADSLQQPTTRLAVLGRWRSVTKAEARSDPLYGTTGIMVSLVVGMLVNVPVRTAEYLAAMPAISGVVPPWLSTLHMLMTLDVVLLSSLYAIAFVAALRRVPLFPRLLASIWLVDVLMQLAIAKFTVAQGGLPPTVASALHTLLDGNVTKVLISVGLWLPYLFLSKRVNVTYRHRVPA